jgi:hypothetical protein
MMSASTLAPWTPPTVMQAEVVNLLTSDAENMLGALYYSGLMKVLDVYAGVPVATQVIEQNNIFGDCSLMVRTAPPETFTVAHAPDLAVGTLTLAVQVAGPAGSMVAVSSGAKLYGTGRVDASGLAIVLLAQEPVNESQLGVTVTGYNMVPYEGTLQVTGGTTTVNEESPSSPPPGVALLGNYPNPFNPSTRIVFTLPQAMSVRMAVYDLRGRRVRTLVAGQLDSGRQEVAWEGRDDAGRGQPSGTYFYRLEAGAKTLTGTMVLHK